jgi:hypothetical protein
VVRVTGEPLVLLVARAVNAGVRIGRSRAGALTLNGRTEEGRALGEQLRAREADVLQLYDWYHARLDEPERCLLCGQYAILRDPVEHRPCHKVCINALIRPAST